MVGLIFLWNVYKIYCLEVIRRFVIVKFGVNGDFVVGFFLDECVVINLDEVGKEIMIVMFVDVNYCFGFVMFIFDGYFGKIFYIGDFCYCECFIIYFVMKGK